MDTNTPPKPDDLQFDKAELAEGDERHLNCSFCHGDLYDVYFEVNGQTSCERCRYEIEKKRTAGTSVGRFSRALFAGGGAAVVGAGIYYAVLALTGYEIGLVAIIVGLLVGFAVRWGSRGRGGWVYQTLAMVLTYMAIVSTYVPFIIEEVQKQELASESEQVQPDSEGPVAEPQEGDREASDTAPSASAEGMEEPITLGSWLVAVVLLFLFIMAIPFLAGIDNLIGLVIIGIALYEAWKINRFRPLVVEGPFQISKTEPPKPTPSLESAIP
jgi:hypothetical protein